MFLKVSTVYHVKTFLCIQYTDDKYRSTNMSIFLQIVLVVFYGDDDNADVGASSIQFAVVLILHCGSIDFLFAQTD